jgi:hypothetical protein
MWKMKFLGVHGVTRIFLSRRAFKRSFYQVGDG